MLKEIKLLEDMRKLDKELRKAQVKNIKERETNGEDFEKHVAYVIEKFPLVFGKGGRKRPWLDMKCWEMGLDNDRMNWDEGSEPNNN